MKRVVLVAIFALAACNQGSPDQGLAHSVDHGGPKVAFDLSASPLPLIPFLSKIEIILDKYMHAYRIISPLAGVYLLALLEKVISLFHTGAAKMSSSQVAGHIQDDTDLTRL